MMILILSYDVQVGHMRTNKACPMYAGNTSSTQPINVALTEEQEEEMEKGGIEESEELINVDGTKIKLSSKVIKVMIYVIKVIEYDYDILNMK